MNILEERIREIVQEELALERQRAFDALPDCPAIYNIVSLLDVTAREYTDIPTIPQENVVTLSCCLKSGHPGTDAEMHEARQVFPTNPAGPYVRWDKHGYYLYRKPLSETRLT